MRAARDGVKAGRKPRIYPDRETIASRFRLIPEQPNVYPGVLEHMVRCGIRQVEGGWIWKFDPTLFDYLEMGADQRDKFVALPCPTAVVLGEHSTDEAALYGDYTATLKGPEVPLFRIRAPTTT